MSKTQSKALLAGWFSFENMGATAGDVLVCDLVCEWLHRAGREYDVARAAPFSGGVDWREVDPRAYGDLVFVCGPCGRCKPLDDLLARFSHCRLSGLNLSMIEPLSDWNPFAFLAERDSSERTLPDLTFAVPPKLEPVVGLSLVHPQNEYGSRARHTQVEKSIRELLNAVAAAVIPIDTRLDVPENPLRSPAQIESVIARMDLIVTTRLHGMVFALKHGVPAIAVDPIAGGAKILAQARAIGWPIVFTPETLTPESLRDAWDYCLSRGGAQKALDCAKRAARRLRSVESAAIAAFC